VVENLSTGQIEYANMEGGVFAGWVSESADPARRQQSARLAAMAEMGKKRTSPRLRAISA